MRHKVAICLIKSISATGLKSDYRRNNDIPNDQCVDSGTCESMVRLSLRCVTHQQGCSYVEKCYLCFTRRWLASVVAWVRAFYRDTRGRRCRAGRGASEKPSRYL